MFHLCSKHIPLARHAKQHAKNAQAFVAFECVPIDEIALARIMWWNGNVKFARIDCATRARSNTRQTHQSFSVLRKYPTNSHTRRKISSFSLTTDIIKDCLHSRTVSLCRSRWRIPSTKRRQSRLYCRFAKMYARTCEPHESNIVTIRSIGFASCPPTSIRWPWIWLASPRTTSWPSPVPSRSASTSRRLTCRSWATHSCRVPRISNAFWASRARWMCWSRSLSVGWPSVADILGAFYDGFECIFVFVE